MAVNFRTLGVRGVNIPPEKSITVRPSDFLIGGLLIESERRYLKSYEVKSPEEYREIFGDHIDSSSYGPDAVKGFFDNVVGVDAKLVVQSLVGHNGTSVDAVVATREKADDGADADAYTVEAAYQEELEYGASGNRTSTYFTQVDRFATLAAATCAATGQSYAQLDSVIGFRVGDIVLFGTNGGASPVYKKITQIDEAQKYIYWSGDFEVSGGSGETLAIDDDVTIPGFTVKTYRKSLTGVESEVEEELGRIICSTESDVQDYYVENVHATNRYIKITEASASTLGDRLPADDTAIVYNTSGSYGTAVTSVAAQDAMLSYLDDHDIRFLANPETTDEALQKALETYSKTRQDSPIVIFNIASNRTKAQMITLGNSYSRSDEVTGIIPANWVKVQDPFTTSVLASPRVVPNSGHVMGAWIRTIGQLGIHYVPATNATPIYGTLGVEEYRVYGDSDRTDIAESGINLIQNISGFGPKLMNCICPTSETAYQFGNSILMRNFIKVSSVESLAGSENTPNSLNRVTSDKMAILTFMYQLWNRGSTGDVPEGETFGQFLDASGNATKAEDHFQVIADTTNNTSSSLSAGERNLTVKFTYPAPAQSIWIGVGILLR